MALDPSFIGSVLNALPLDKMISTPLQAMITAQIQASKAYADFLMSVCIKDGKAVTVQFDYEETLVDAEGNAKGVVKKTMRVPLMAAVVHPVITVEEGTIDFEITISQSDMEHSETSGEGGFEAKMGWGPFSVTVHGKVSHKSEQTRKTDTSAKYSIHTKVARQPAPEAIMKIIDFLTDAATKPVLLPENKKDKPDPLPVQPTPSPAASNAAAQQQPASS
ncbi:DUF2589 domain-containing protein [Rivihabitans pingtungensis]|uniref:DUF2589 domain-containing protein n=1 Tax=Rivihabitans pingtungensis TaxID=1054498 RepID=UPI002352E146|nr:DUF2589 domain-containing protein [Rivihabitans pingtungensis]MCK6436326.1 DUF2589 domain-containing protein [Rivihabitans pingtungensis]